MDFVFFEGVVISGVSFRPFCVKLPGPGLQPLDSIFDSRFHWKLAKNLSLLSLWLAFWRFSFKSYGLKATKLLIPKSDNWSICCLPSIHCVKYKDLKRFQNFCPCKLPINEAGCEHKAPSKNAVLCYWMDQGWGEWSQHCFPRTPAQASNLPQECDVWCQLFAKWLEVLSMHDIDHPVQQYS